MTKISFDVDFSKDPGKILQEIQERARAEVEKRENKERNSAFLSKLHETVNEKIGTDFKSVSDLIKALTPFATPCFETNSGTTASGRRKTISMTKEIYDEVKSLLSEANPNKAAIACKTESVLYKSEKLQRVDLIQNLTAFLLLQSLKRLLLHLFLLNHLLLKKKRKK